MKCPRGTILRELNPFKDHQPVEILVYYVRQGRKHPWFVLSGYDLVHKRLYDLVSEGKTLEESFEIVAQHGVEELLTHKEEQARILGGILARNPKIKTDDLFQATFAAYKRLKEDS